MDVDASEIFTYYARRWAIKVFFKDAKKMLYLGKEQSDTFDSVVAYYSIIMMRYILLVYILNKYAMTGPIGPLFRDLAESHLRLYITEKMWASIKELMITSSQLFWPEMEPDRILHILDIVEDSISNQVKIVTAKLQ